MLNRKGKKRCWHLFVSGQNISVSLKGWRRFILTAHWPCTGKLLLVLFVFGVQMFSCFSWQIIDCLCLSECRCGTLSEKSWTGVTLKQSKSTDNIQKQLKYLIIFIKTFVFCFFPQCSESHKWPLHGSLFTHKTPSTGEQLKSVFFFEVLCVFKILWDFLY